MRQVGGGFIGSAARKLAECNLIFALRRFVHERIGSHRRYMKLYHELVPSGEELGTGACYSFRNHFLLGAYA
jgi:hypothetical protein